MAEYQFIKGIWRGHSTNDSIPSQAERYLSRRQDTDTGIRYYWNGAEWKRSDLAFVPSDILTVTELADVTSVSPIANQTLVYQTGSGTYENKKLKTRHVITTTYNGTSNGDRYIAIGSAAGSSGTETNIDLPLGFALTLKKVRIRITTNSRDSGNQVFSVRKNQADVTGTTHTVAFTGTTAFNSADLNVTYAVDDDICIKIAVGGTTGTLTAVIYLEYETEAYA